MSGDHEGLFEIRGLKKHFPQNDSLLTRLHPNRQVKFVRAVDGVDLTVREGETLGLVGESGCGKSTLARTALRLLEPTAGQVFYDGDDVTAYTTDELREFRSEAQFIFQDPFASLNPRYKVRKTLTEPMRVHGIGANKEDRNKRAAALVERVGLNANQLDRYPHEFSGGQRQRIAIARALAVEPKLIVADEAVSALDVSVQAQILNLLNDLREEMGLTMLFISHDLSVIRRISDRVSVMYLGEIVETGDTDEVFADPKHPYAQSLLSSIPVPDPTLRRERIPLEGDVPTPIDPPTGCRFHPRCPKVIPPEDWVGSQEEWRRIMRFKTTVANDNVNPDAVRSQLAASDGEVTDEAVRNAIYEEYISREGVADAETVELGEDHERDIREAISLLQSEGFERASASLDDRYTTVCETQVPERLSVGDERMSKCHLYDESLPGDPVSLATIQGAETDADVATEG